ncbi:MAG: hypothetical protein IPL59_26775 [Candidatus Competibacteraceae bacterium]|nr:hypothetical protein [Candidatus Competibacteraceae bacterium]
MMEFLSEYGMFLHKPRPCGSNAGRDRRHELARRGDHGDSRGRLDIRHLNEDYGRDGTALQATLSEKALKATQKERQGTGEATK